MSVCLGPRTTVIIHNQSPPSPRTAVRFAAFTDLSSRVKFGGGFPVRGVFFWMWKIKGSLTVSYPALEQ